jgi:Leucine-rich repeat (LRR) protein
VNVIGLDIVEDDNVAGTIPGAAIVGLANLVDLTLYKVPGLYGPIPKELARISGLFALTVTGTGVSGPVPSYLGTLTALQFLDLSSNRLTGGIPPSLAAQPHITSIDLSGNRLSGGIPVEVLNLDGLQFFNVSSNRLCGMVPSGSAARFGESAFQPNKCLCGDAGLPPCHHTN